MECNKIKELMMGYIDGELSGQEDIELKRHIASCSACAKEFESYKKLARATDGLKLPQPEEELWQRYWNKVYNRLERRLGWGLFITGLAVVICIMADLFFKAPGISMAFKIGCAGFLLGFIALFISVLREQRYAARHERYGDIKK